jgi:hypothetical protein
MRFSTEKKAQEWEQLRKEAKNKTVRWKQKPPREHCFLCPGSLVTEGGN